MKCVVLLLALLSVSAAHAYEVRQFCDRGGSCFACVKGTPTCEVSYALSRGLTPPPAPSLNRILPPSPSPNPGPLYPERAQQRLPPSGQQRGLSETEWRQAIIDEAQKFCEVYPKNAQCHWKPPPPQQ
jgi:hypothetical protein